MTVVRRGLRLLVTAGMLLAAVAGRANADMCDLSLAGGSTCGATFGPSYSGQSAIFRQIDAPAVPAGKYKNDFLGLQPASGQTSEKGYNTDAATQSGFNMIDSQTHALRLNDIAKVRFNDIDYRQFFLDIQETTAAPRLSVDELQIFLGPDGLQANYGSGKLNGISPIYDLDSGLDRWIKLDMSLNPTGTVGDMVAYIPDSLFTNPNSNPYVYLFFQAGLNFSADGSFEEWWVNSPLAPPPSSSNPEPASLALLGSGLMMAAYRLGRSKSRRRTGKGAAETTKVVPDRDFEHRLL